MIHRALFGSIERFFGSADRALRRARSRRGSRRCRWSASRSPTSTSSTCSRWQRRCGTRGSGSRWTLRTTGCRRRSATTPRTRCRSCCLPAARTWRPVRCRSGSATAARSTACRWTAPSRRWRTGSRAGRTHRPRRRRLAFRMSTLGSTMTWHQPELVVEQEGVGRPGRAAAAVDSAPDGLHPGREQAGRRRRARAARSAGLIELDDADASDHRARGAGCTRC